MLKPVASYITFYVIDWQFQHSYNAENDCKLLKDLKINK